MVLEIINKLFLKLSQVATAFTYKELNLERIMNEHRDGRLAALEKLAKVEAQRDAWKHAAEIHYREYRIARYGDGEANYPAEGALDAWAAARYPAIKEALTDSPG